MNDVSFICMCVRLFVYVCEFYMYVYIYCLACGVASGLYVFVSYCTLRHTYDILCTVLFICRTHVERCNHIVVPMNA